MFGRAGASTYAISTEAAKTATGYGLGKKRKSRNKCMATSQIPNIMSPPIQCRYSFGRLSSVWLQLPTSPSVLVDS